MESCFSWDTKYLSQIFELGDKGYESHRSGTPLFCRKRWICIKLTLAVVMVMMKTSCILRGMEWV